MSLIKAGQSSRIFRFRDEAPDAAAELPTLEYPASGNEATETAFKQSESSSYSSRCGVFS